ncbi:MAG: hypothetical protein M0038_00860 [Pseudomonadota bacterium]|nr:hypothetical protein [Pseudomonadota bacterium]
MARMTISIPDALQKRMRRTKSENWSAVAAAAFEARLTEVQQNMRQQEVEKVARKLKAEGLRLAKDGDDGDDKGLVEKLEFQAEWRDQKAEEYPDDVRNRNSATALRQLAEHLDKIPRTDQLWIRYARVWEQDDVDTFRFVEYEDEELRPYGFHNEPAEVTMEDAVQFLEGHVEDLERLLAEAMVE